MVLTMEVEQPTTQGQICDTQNIGGISHQRSIDIQLPSAKSNVDVELAKRTMKLDLTTTTSGKLTNRQKSKEDDEKQSDVKSPRSPLSGTGRIVTHQSSITSQIDIVDNDRKALRDALYQGIFSRHRRTIFAFGSFLRMLRRNSQYNTIRSSSEDEGR